MARRIAALALAIAGFLITGQFGRADERMVPLAVSGDWVAMAHQTSMTARADVCLVLNGARGIAIRAGEEGVQFRVMNKEWALPSGIQGSISVGVGDWKAALEIDDNTDTMVNAEIPPDVTSQMFAAMDKATTMSVIVGKARPLIVSLSGSTRATNAFRTCAGIGGSSKVPGANPFE